MAVYIPMSRFIVRYADGRSVTFTAFSATAALDWARTQGRIASWTSQVDDKSMTTPPTWTHPAPSTPAAEAEVPSIRDAEIDAYVAAVAW